MKKKKICVITGTRAEYGLLYWILIGLEKSQFLDLQLISTCMHHSPEFGLTYKEIEKDGFCISKKIEILLSSDTPVGVTKSIGLGMIGFADAYNELRPDFVIILGDRFELLAAASAALVARIPIVHIHGGETTEGAIDESIRHSITKMSHIHFTTTESHKNRVLQLGENPENVYNFGAPGIDNIFNLKLLTRKQLEKKINLSLGKESILVTFHPVTLEKSTAENQFQNLLDVLGKLSNIRIIFTKSNADTDGRIINKMIDQFVAMNSSRSVAFTSLGQLLYLSSLKNVNGVVGNSSSGLIEAPSLRIGTVNIGDRQLGRERASSVIDCQPDFKSIEAAIVKLFSFEFKKLLKNVSNPYGNGDASNKIVEVLERKSVFKNTKKHFFDY